MTRLKVNERSLEEVWFTEARGPAARHQEEFGNTRVSWIFTSWAGSHTPHVSSRHCGVTPDPIGEPGVIWYGAGK